MSAWIYARLLVCFPVDFRARFGASMVATFTQGMATRRGLARLRFLARAYAGAVTSGIAERAAAPRTSRPVVDRLAEGAHDVRIALRMMRRQPGLSAMSIVTLAVGIASTASVFSLLDAALFRPVALPDSGRLVAIRTTVAGNTGSSAHDDVRDWIAQSKSFDALAAIRAQTANRTGLDTPATVRGGFVVGDFFAMAGVAPAIGRALGPVDHDPASPPAVVITDVIWRRHFQAAPDVLGRVMQLNNIQFSIVGVMPAGFSFPYDGIDAFMPVRFHTGTMSRSARSVAAFGRMKPGVSVAQAQTELAAIEAGLAATFPATNEGRGVIVTGLHEWLTSDMREQLTIIFALVIVLLIAACANVTSLQIGAAARRRSEIGVRVALGAGRARVARQLVTEHLVLAAVAGVLGVLGARLIVPVATQYAQVVPSFNIYGLDRVAVDARVLVFAAVITVLAGLASGVMPAWHWARHAPVNSLRATGRAIGERRLTRTRTVLVIGQVGMAAVLLTAGGLLVKSYVAILRVDPGFDATGVWSLEYRLPANKYKSGAVQTAFHDAVAAKIATIPGVRHAAVARALPLSGNGDMIQLRTDRDAPNAPPRTAGFNTVSDGFFAALGIPLIEGRTFDATDHANAPFVTVISKALADRLWPGESAVGRVLVADGTPLRPRVIGVVGDVRHYRLADEPLPMIYGRNVQNAGIFMTVIAKVDGDDSRIADEIKRAVWSLDPDQPVWKVRTLASLVAGASGTTRFMFAALAIFAAAAVLLVAAGLYGVISQGVTERAREIGLRMALGAERRAVLQQVLGAGLKLTLIGLAIGLAGSLGVLRLMEGALYRTSPFDALPYVATAVVLGLIAALACYLPARRAADMDPARVLRD